MNPQWPVDSRHIEPPMWKVFPYDYFTMDSIFLLLSKHGHLSLSLSIYIYNHVSEIHYDQGKCFIWKIDKNTTCNILNSYICQFKNLIKYPNSMCMYNLVSICELILSTIKFLYQYIWSSTHKLHAPWEISGLYFMICGPGKSSGKQCLGEVLQGNEVWNVICLCCIPVTQTWKTTHFSNVYHLAAEINSFSIWLHKTIFMIVSMNSQ